MTQQDRERLDRMNLAMRRLSLAWEGEDDALYDYLSTPQTPADRTRAPQTAP